MMKTYLQTRSQNDLLDAFDDFFRPMFYETPVSAMRTDILEQENAYSIEIEMPGFQKEEIKISLDNGYLTVSAEKAEKEENGKYLRKESRMSCRRSYYVGGEIDEAEIKAKYDRGVLCLVLPKKVKKTESHTISVE